MGNCEPVFEGQISKEKRLVFSFFLFFFFNISPVSVTTGRERGTK